ncbi:unnamed protein product [Lathyrus oleraceus]|uniref:Uncharacterized protein n=1 Tax=Pisum sativum TaxID=3888 RepID=A0A9D5B3N2_PEA|nr:uncharacterized protein LOC127126926 [Pisum sativum]KAI5428334.1 hypothetical protein KIW84_033361 [Pisum sativum]
MVLQTLHDNKLEDDDKLVCSSIDSPLHQAVRLPHNHSSYHEDYSFDFLSALKECSPISSTALVGSKILRTCLKKVKQNSITGNRSSHLDNNGSCVAPAFALDWRHALTSELHWYNTYVPRDAKFQHGYTYKYNQQIRKEIVQYISSFVVSTTVFLGIFYNIWSRLLSSISVQSLQKEHDHRLSIWLSLLGLIGIMVFVCAVAAMILVGAVFTRTQKAMLIFWVVLMHLQSANSIIEAFVTLIGGIFMGWYAFGEKQPPNEVI